MLLFLVFSWRIFCRIGGRGVSSSGGGSQSLWSVVETKILHLVGRHEILVHATLEVALAQHAALFIVHAAVGAQAAEVRLHDVLAFGIVVERKRAALGSAMRSQRVCRGFIVNASRAYGVGFAMT